MKLSPLTIEVFICIASAVSCTPETTGPLASTVNAEEILFTSEGIGVDVRSFTETTDAALSSDGFKVAVVIDEDNNVMFNEQVTKDADNKFRVSGKKYFYPASGTISCYAVYPKTEDIDINASGIATISYTHNPDEDLVVAKAVNVAQNGSAVNLAFTHALCQLTINVEGDNPDLEYTLSSLKMKTLPNSGKLNFSECTWSVDEESEYEFVSESMNVEGKVKVAGPISLIPCKTELQVRWTVKKDGIALGEYDQAVSVELEKGKHSSFNLIIPSNTGEITIKTDVLSWQNISEDIYITDEKTFTISAVASVPSTGTVTGGGKYPEGKTVTLEAIPAHGHLFSKWDDNNTENPRVVNVDRDSTFTAYFIEKPKASISLSVNDTSFGSVTGSGSHYIGDTVTVKATAAKGYAFRKWNDDVTDNPRNIIVEENISLTAIFSPASTYKAYVTIEPVGAGTVSGSNNEFIEEGKFGSLTAKAADGYTFDHWSDGGNSKKRYDKYENDIYLTAYFTTQTDASYMVCTYNVTNVSETKISSETSVISSMSVDGGAKTAPVKTYAFGTLGEHTVAFYLKDDAESLSYLFEDCTALKRVDGTHTNTSKVTNFGGMFNKCSSLTTVEGFADWDMSKCGESSLPPGWITISTGFAETKAMFQLCSSLSHIDVPATLPMISGFMFNHNSAADNEEVYIPASVKKIGAAHCFYNCGKDGVFKRFVVDPASTTFKAVDGVLLSFDGTELYSIPRALLVEDNTYEIPEGVTKLGELSFSREKTFTRLVLPDSYIIKEYGHGDIDGNGINYGNSLSVAIYSYTAINEYAVKDSNPNYIASDGCIYSKDGTRLIAVPTNKQGVITVREGCTAINREAIWESAMGLDADNTLISTMTGIHIPASVTSIYSNQIEGYNNMVDKKGWVITVNPENPVYTVTNNKLTTK